MRVGYGGAVSGPELDTEPVEGYRRGMSVRDEHRELTHQRLLSAAEAVFQRDGYSRTTAGSITRAANVNRATFYLHFTDKADIMLAVIRANLADTPAYFADVDAALVDGSREALRASLSNTLNWYEQHERTLGPAREALAVERDLAKKIEGNFAGFADEMSGFLACVPPDERERTHLQLQLLIIQLDQLAFRLVVQRWEGIDREVMLDVVTDTWRLVLPKPHRTG